jgi:hypothetical protein
VVLDLVGTLLEGVKCTPLLISILDRWIDSIDQRAEDKTASHVALVWSRAIEVLSRRGCPYLDLEHHLGDEVLGQVEQVMVVGIGLVELTRRELGVVRHVDALVPAKSSQGRAEMTGMFGVRTGPG